MTYYNTTHLHGVELREYQAKAHGQEKRTAEWFEQNPTVEATREDIVRLLFPNAPQRSGARVMANLTEAGVLEKVPNKQIKGEYGRPIGFWRYRQREPQQEDLF